MFCPRCGAQNEAGEATCLRCGTPLPQPRPAETSETNRETSAPSANAPAATSPLSDPPSPGSSPSFDDSVNYPPPPGQSFPPPPPSAQGYGAQPPYGGGQPGWTPGSGQQTYGNQPPYGGVPGYQIGNTPNYGSPGYGGGQPIGEVPNYLVWSILVTIVNLFCCFPIGIVAIVYSSQVNSKLQNGDYAGALDASNKAKMWCFISAGATALLFVLGILISIAGG